MKNTALVALSLAALALAACNNPRSSGSSGSSSIFSSPSGGSLFGSGSSAPASGCATMMHQDLPGGSDYHGPPVAGC